MTRDYFAQRSRSAQRKTKHCRCSRFTVGRAIAEAVWNTCPAPLTGRRPRENCVRDRQRHLCVAKKTGRKIKFSSRVEVRGCDSESFRNRYQASGLNASFSSLIFSSLLSFSLPSTIPPFQSATRGDV